MFLREFHMPKLAIRPRVLAPLAALFLVVTSLQAASVPTGYQDFRITGNEEHVWDILQAIAVGEGQNTFDNGAAGFLLAMNSVVTLTASADAQVVIYDHWEDGFEADILNPVQATTLVLGDDDISNGRACDFSTDPAVSCGGATPDSLFKGTELTFNSNQSLPTCGVAPCIARQPVPAAGNACASAIPASPADRRCSVPLPRDSADIRYDGGDRLLTSGGPISLVHSQNPLSPFIGGSSEVIPREAVENAVSYTIPIGEDLYSGDNTTTESLKYAAPTKTAPTSRSTARVPASSVSLSMRESTTAPSASSRARRSRRSLPPSTPAPRSPPAPPSRAWS